MNLFLQVVEANDLPSMDLNGLADPYCKCYLSTQKNNKQSTKIIEKTLQPKWNELLVFDMSGVQQSDCLCIDMKDKDLVTSEYISSCKIQFSSIVPGKVFDIWVPMTPYKKVKKGGKLHLVLHAAPKGSKPFVESSQQESTQEQTQENKQEQTQENTQEEQENSQDNTQEGQENTQDNTQEGQENAQEQEEVVDRGIDIGAEVELIPEIPKFDYTRYKVYVVAYTKDEISYDDTSSSLAENIVYKLIERGCNALYFPISSSIADSKDLFKLIQKDPKALMVLIGATTTTRKIKIIDEAFNETNFMISDINGEAPVGEKIFNELEYGEIIPNPIDIESIISSYENSFSIYHDQDRFLFNYLYAQCLKAIGNVIGGCVFIQVPSFIDINCPTQTAYILDLVEKLLVLPEFNDNNNEDEVATPTD